MKKVIKIVSYLLLLILQQCAIPKTVLQNSETVSQVVKQTVDTSLYIVFAYDSSKMRVFKNAIPTSLTEDEIIEIEDILKKGIDKDNTELIKRFDSMSLIYPGYKNQVQFHIINLSKYKRQYVPAINEKGEKEVWVNCICDGSGYYWKKYIITVEDGGNCHFNLKINLSTKECYDIIVNGHA